MNVSVVLSVVCDDRPGIVRALSRLLEDHGGNWTESSMLSLAGKFAGILLANVPEERADAFVSALDTLRDEGMHIVVQRSEVHESQPAARDFTLELVGQDRPGIVHDITDILSRHGINVLELDTGCESASMSGEVLFRARARVRVPDGTALDTVRDELEDLANELMVDLSLEG